MKVMNICFVFSICAGFFVQVQSATLAGKYGTTTYNKRGLGDTDPLQVVVDHLTQRLLVVETAYQRLEQRMTAQEKKRCVSGELTFTPHDEPTVVFPGSALHRERTEIHHVTFSPPFDSVPAISFGFSKLDADKNANLRADADIRNLNTNGFDLAVFEWQESINYYVYVSWMACSQ